MQREYHKWFSTHLQRDMELLVFGYAGKPIVFFPTRTARFYDFEDWRVIDALEHRIAKGELQVFCVDSADKDSFYNKALHPAERIKKHIKYEDYILFEVLPFIRNKNNNPYLISAGCSLGAYHAVNIAFRYPSFFKKVVGMSGRYDLTMKLEYFADLFDGYHDETIYYHQPSQYMPNLEDEHILGLIRKMDIILAIGKEDAFLPNNVELSNTLKAKNIHHKLDFWDGEAHKARFWSEMVKIYF